MKKLFCLALFLGIFFIQCKEKKDVSPVEDSAIKEFTVPGISDENISILKNVVVINLPENYPEGNFIKPVIKLNKNVTTTSEVVNGFKYEGEIISLELESELLGKMQYTICVVPFTPIRLSDPAKNFNIIIEPDAQISIPVSFHGTALAVNDSGRIVDTPTVILTGKSSGSVSQSYPGYIVTSNGVSRITIQLPATAHPGEYTADVVWGTKKARLSDLISIKSGPFKIMRSAWWLSPESSAFKVYAYNISSSSRYQLVLNNDFVKDRKIDLMIRDAGTLIGNVPDDLPAGNYKAVYLVDGKVLEGFGNETLKLMGEPNFFKKKSSTQPILRIITQPSKQQKYNISSGISVDYYEPSISISRSELLLAQIERVGAFTENNDLKLVNQTTGKEYNLTCNSGGGYSIFDGFMVFMIYNITSEVPDGEYEVYVVTGVNHEKSERYNRIITIH